MRVSAALNALTATASLTLLASCSSGSAIAPQSVPLQRGANFLMSQAPNFTSFYACPAMGALKYVSDYWHSTINVYSGRFAGQAPCGVITSNLENPVGLQVKVSTHDLYVANWVGRDVLVFHRGETTPYNMYSGPGSNPMDVDVAPDGTLVASNFDCTLSTWIIGSNGGTFVGKFGMPDCRIGNFIFLAINKKGTVYYTNGWHGQGPGRSTLWSVSCPAGACGVPTLVAGVKLGSFSAGLAVDSTNDLIAVEESAGWHNNQLFTFELPDPSPRAFHLIFGEPLAMTINPLDHHVYVTQADRYDGDATEYSYPNGEVLGSVDNVPGGILAGIAIDP